MIKVRVRSRTDREHLQLVYTDPLTGNRRTKSAGTDNWTKAERAAAKWEVEVNSSTTVSNLSWDHFRVRFEDEYMAHKADSTQTAYASSLNHFEKIIGRVRRVSLIDASLISKFQAELRKNGMPNTTIAKHLRQIGVALNWAESIGVIQSAPKIRKPKLPKRTLRGRSLSLVEVAHFLRSVPAVVPGEHVKDWQCFIKLMWLTGLRLGEAHQLHWKTGPVRLDLSCKHPRIIFQFDGQKNNSDEKVPLTSDAIRLLMRIKSRSGFVAQLKGEKGRRVTPVTASKWLSDIGEHSGIQTSESKFASAHDLRRTFGTRWALRVHPIVLKVLMRHADLKTTLKYYVDIDCDEIARQLVHAHVHKPAGNRSINRDS